MMEMKSVSETRLLGQKDLVNSVAVKVSRHAGLRRGYCKQAEYVNMYQRCRAVAVN